MTNGPVRTRLRLTADGFAVVVISLCILGASYVQHVNLLLLLFAFLSASAITAALFCRRNLKGVSVERKLPPEAFVGKTALVQIELSRKAGRKYEWGVVVEDALEQDGAPRERPRVYFQSLAPRSRRRQSYEIHPRQRGRIDFKQLHVSSRFPLGVFERQCVWKLEDSLVVFPQLGQLHETWRRRMRGQHSLFASRTPDSGVNDFDFHSLREYRTGDSLRHIHWRTTARRGEVMVKEFEPLETRDTLLLLDPWLEADASPERRQLFERLISFVATCCVELCRWPGNRLVLVVASQNPTVFDRQTSPRAAADLLTALSLLQSEDSTSLPQALDAIPLKRNSHMAVCVAGMRGLGEFEPHLRQVLGPSLSRSETIQFLDASAGDVDPIFTLDPL